MITWLQFIVIVFLLIQYIGNAKLILNGLAFNFDRYNTFYDSVIKEFNKFANETNQDIEIELNLISSDSVGTSLDNSRSMIEAVLKNKADKYDLYFYETTYISLYGSYLLNLNQYLSEDFIDMYDPKLISSLCLFDNNLIGIPIFLLYTGFYAHGPLLQKYNKPIPKTWDEMIETGKYILNEERKSNNTDNTLTGYNGLFNDNEQGILSIIEFIYSFRDSVDASFPKVESPSFIKALETMKKIKEELSSDEEFRSNEGYTMDKIIHGNSIFLKYWILGEPIINEIPYIITNLPGSKEGISTSIPSGCNIGIYGKIEEEKIEAAVTALKFISSKEVQREYLKRRLVISAINSLYDEKEVCEVSDCELFKNMQPANNPNFSLNNNKEELTYIRKYIYKYLYKDATIDEVIKNIIDITKIYVISLDTTYSYVGLISSILILVSIIFMLILLIPLFRENFNPFFKYFSTDFWIISVFGSIAILCIPFTYFGEITKMNCYLRSLIQSLGISLTFIPILYNLVEKFPNQNQLSIWVKKYKYRFLFFFIILDIIWNSLLLIEPYKIEEVKVEDGQNFKICISMSTLCKVIVILKWIYIFILFFIEIFLIFIEWNIQVFHYELKFFVTVIYIDILFMLFIICFTFVLIQNYVEYYLVHFIIHFIIAITNYILIYGFRLLFAFLRKKDVKIQFINTINKEFIEKDGLELKKNSPSTFIQSSCINEDNDINIESNYFSTANINNGNSNNTFNSENEDHSRLSRSKMLLKIIDYHYNADSMYFSNTNSNFK
ncbi:periplasmic binding protein-like II [Neocallimastix californiae]|uniref:Periplasmic binding protein-like II n=1 Tax=Neocallimastix californiae TaxID=1754190 RepID=A0A1Y1ZDC3_9FUNG|nr:periplasmic binding protein-like II [Neocallimastix californiae]|eukprot:ORY08238.1 periplasmic binding protein-like II [Neocallimastix californiae]